MPNNHNPIEESIKEKEAEAKEFKQWLNDNPDASAQEKNYAKRKLFTALQAINDLVFQKTSKPPYQLH